ncbi:MAG: hypothetical protein LBV74_19955 [Tannerella sp.]|jgi:hypothetical protein|nr:hypothetical protein [Tannerella sp.]
MKQHAFTLCFLILMASSKAHGCADYSIDSYYFNLFAQEIIRDPRYTPFLRTEESRFYDNGIPKRNANIEEWEQYLGLPYDNTYYLVFKASRDNINALINGDKTDDPKLGFITKDIVSRQKQALLYLAYAKYLEPFMRITHEESENGWGYYYSENEEASQLDYEKVTTVLSRSWKAEKDKELKLRYGYQLVRFAHYNRKYEDAIEYFNTYVEPLNYKPEMYYYALSQKAGALRGSGDILQANTDFMKVFSHSTDLKETAYSSMYLSYESEVDFYSMLSEAKTENERNDIYLLLGYKSFNNPLNEIRKIISTTPDAIQAKILIVRAINELERVTLPTLYSYDAKTKNDRYPVINANETKNFLTSAISLSSEIIQSATDKNFWNMAASYLCFLDKDFSEARNYLSKVNTPDEIYKQQKNLFTAYIDICEQPIINQKAEEMISERYMDLLSGQNGDHGQFIRNVLSNRYFIQQEYAKAFLITNNLNAIEMNLQINLLNSIEQFYNKKDKNNFEKWMVQSIQAGKYEVNDYLKYLYGITYLTNGEILMANQYFKSADNDFGKVSDHIFGYNIREWFSGDEDLIMRKAYTGDFPSIEERLSYKDVTDILVELDLTAKMNGEKAAKACYLIGNFYYNVSSTGYFRQYLRFDDNNGYSYNKYHQFSEKESEHVYKYYENKEENLFIISYDLFTHFRNTTDIAESYLQKALRKTKDDELKAHILFSLAKIDQESQAGSSSYYYFNDNTIYSKTYFDELKKLSKTHLYKEINQYCKYFNYYINNN